jgi:hypothetical protein
MFTAERFNFDTLKFRGLDEKHVAANMGIWEPSQHLLGDRGKTKKPVSRLPVAAPCEYTPKCRKQKDAYRKSVSLTYAVLLY